MAIKQSEVKRILFCNTFFYNALLFFYPSIITLIFLLLKKHNIADVGIFENYFSLVSSFALWKLILFFIFLPAILSLIFAPLISLFTSAVQEIPSGLIANAFLLALLPFNIFCCLFIFIGSFFHFFTSLVWSKIQFVDDPHLFQWNTYVFILKPEKE